jgi:tetratricopeptide (TPR) repeat protein
MKKRSILLSVFITWSMMSQAQSLPSVQKEKAATRAGNSEFGKANYPEAESNYRKALELKNNMPEATFNLGDAVYEQKRFEEAGKQFQLSAQTNADAGVKAKAYHNLGNSLLQQKKWEDAIRAYKNALKLNPGDQDTKYNLAYANAMLQKQNESGQNQNQENKKDDQQQEQQQNQDEDKQRENQQQNQQQQDPQQPQNQQPQQSKLSKEEAEQLLQALANEEQKTAQKVQQKNMKAVKVKTKKDW